MAVDLCIGVEARSRCFWTSPGPVTLIGCILSLCALFHTAFLLPSTDMNQRIYDSLTVDWCFAVRRESQAQAGRDSQPHFPFRCSAGLRALCSLSLSFPGTWKDTASSTVTCASDGVLRVIRVWGQRLFQVMFVMVVLLELLYAGDWVVLRFRVAHGTAYGTVEVNQFLATPLKGNKVEYDMMGTVQQACSRSIFPQRGNPACWWLERHKSQWE